MSGNTVNYNFNMPNRWTAPMIDFSYMGTSMPTSFGANDWSAPMFNFGAVNPWGGFGGTSFGGSTSEANMSDEQIKAKRKRERETYSNLVAKEQEIKAQQKEIQVAETKLKKSKNADGTATVVKDLKEMSFFKKLGRGAWNAFIGFGNLCKGLVGYDKEGKWNPVKCIRNVAIAAGMAVVCVYAAPVAIAIAAKLGASTVTAATVGAVTKGVLVTAPAVGALAGGTVKAGKGIYDACNAETTEEFDKATESVGQGVAVAFAARAGLKSMSASAELASSGIKGTFVNPFKAGIKEAEAAVDSMTIATGSAGTASLKNLNFFEAVGAGRSGIKNLHADVKMKEFNASLDKTKNSIRESLTELEAKIKATTNPKERALLEHRYNANKTCLERLEAAVKSSDWKDIRKAAEEANKQVKPYKWYNRGSSQYEINGQKFTKSELKALRGNDQVLQKSTSATDFLIGITKQKFKVMSNVSGASNYADEVANFGMSNKWYAQPYNWGYAKCQQGFTKGQLFGAVMTLTAPVYALQPVLNNPMMAANNIAILVDPSYEKSTGDIITKEEVEAQEAELKAAKEQLNKEKAKIKDQKKKLAKA